ncbi:hypothetical protein ACIGD1_11225 [Streptomyces sp. NPDC085612]|uniref:hypothetical protein n=1 Tax=Streptomyces sp. NPDC085612 TaxID=3365732 RepID=UPI0037CFDDE8
MAHSLIPTNEPCRRCGVNQVKRRSELSGGWGNPEPIVRVTKPYCANGCTRQQLDAYDREQAGEA